jgi:integrase
VIGTNRPAEPQSRDRVLTDTELVAIWNACREDDYGHIVRLLMLSGQRRNEVGGMSWSELNLEQETWCIPGARTKNKRAHTIALPHGALAIIAKAERLANKDHLFGTGRDGFGGWSRAKAALDRRIDKARGTMAAWTIHDLRRTVATGMADLGVLPHVIEAALNHISGHKAGVAGVYNRSSYERETRAALARWADHLRSVVEGGKRKIVPFEVGHHRAS